MKRFKDSDFDREKKLHKIVKGNKVDKHKKTIYNYVDEELDDDIGEQYLDEVESSTNTH